MASRATQCGTNPDNTFEVIVPGTTQTKITTSGSSQQSAAFSTGVSVVRLFATEDCYIKFGSDPTAAATDMFLPGGIIEHFGVTAGEKLAVIQSSVAGTLHITEAAAS